jgi:adenylate cyclase
MLMDPADDGIEFAPEREEAGTELEPWTVLVVDDDDSVHEVTRLALADLEFEGRGLKFISAYSAGEAEGLLREHTETALVLLDVVMESDHAGLGLVSYVREVLGNRLVRIVLRTGQPGQAPERSVIVEYDISDYKTKVELTAGKLFTSVIAALRTFEHLREIESHRRTAEAGAAALRRFVPTEMLRLLARPSLADLGLGDQIQREMTVMFADVRDFTAWAESLTPAQCFEFVNRVFQAVCPEVRAHGGFIDKFLGDGFLALFPGSADTAARASVAIQRRMDGMTYAGRTIKLGVGLHTGQVVVGTVGEPERMEATVLSDDVNLAARVQELTKTYGARVLLSEQTLARLSHELWGLRFIGVARVAGKRAETAVYELLDGDAEGVRAGKQSTYSDFLAGVDAYHAGAFTQACVLLERVLQKTPGDEAARLFLRRSAEGLLRSLPREDPAMGH